MSLAVHSTRPTTPNQSLLVVHLEPVNPVQRMLCVVPSLSRVELPKAEWNYQLEEPFCMPFGNRRLMHCLNITSSAAPPPPSRQAGPPPQHPPDRVPAGQPPHHEQSQHPQGETLAWESCGRIVSQEVADFYEFVACNVLFAILALFVLFARSKRLQAMQARQLAARIGLIRGTGGRR